MTMKDLEALKEQVLTGKKFEDIWNYFFDHYAETDEFFAAGNEVENPDLALVLEKVAQQQIGKTTAKASNFIIVKLNDHDFFHGTFAINGCMANFMFFKDIDVGMIVIARSMRSTDVTFSRFSFTQILQGSAAASRQSPN